MTEQANLPMGIENFKEMRTKGYYYIDKTGMIKTLLENPGKVNLFTRPRRFGKTLNMSMLKYFFGEENGSQLFDGLEIFREKELCNEYMGKFPVISITLKAAAGENFTEAKEMLRRIIGKEAMRFPFLMNSSRLTQSERGQYRALIHTGPTGAFAMPDELLKDSLQLLSQLLQKHYRQNVIILIDEYDVPLDQAYASGYYDSMVKLLQILFGNAFKTNDSLELAVLTGCLRISKESIFTGMNNFKVYTVKDVRYKEYFGFTDLEVRNMLEYYGLTAHYEAVKEWYDGYLFGNLAIYCPWDVINYCALLRSDPDARPENYWANSSGNDIVRRFIREAGDRGTTKREIESLSIDNIWSVLFTTGYLTQRGRGEGRSFWLAIPNLEVREIFTTQIMNLFKKDAKQDGKALDALCHALQNGDAGEAQQQLRKYLKKTISIRDTFARKELKENFYHGMLLGLLAFKGSWVVTSNREAGEGYADILVEIDDDEEPVGIVIEVKYARDGNMDTACQSALEQIENRQYGDAFYNEDIEKALKYGIAFYKDKCRVVLYGNE